jgi:hypothetical protein
VWAFVAFVTFAAAVAVALALGDALAGVLAYAAFWTVLVVTVLLIDRAEMKDQRRMHEALDRFLFCPDASEREAAYHLLSETMEGRALIARHFTADFHPEGPKPSQPAAKERA